MALYPSKKTISNEELMRNYGDVISAFVEALIAGDMDVDVKLVDTVENVPEHVRVAIVEKMREMVRARSEEKAEALDEAIAQQKLLEKQAKSHMMQVWLAHVMSQETLRKIREAFMMNPSLKQQLDTIGSDLVKKGVLQQRNPNSNAQELGELNAQVQHQQKREQDSGKGRG